MTGRTPSRLQRTLSIILLLLIGFGIGFNVARRTGSTTSGTSGSFLASIEQVLRAKAPAADPTLFGKVWNFVTTEYVNQPTDEQTLFYGAIEGMVNALGDRYSSFFDPEASKAFKQDLGETSFSGIGAEIGVRGNNLVIIAPLPDSPAEKAGLQAGDRLLSIDATDAADLSVDQAVVLIRGQKGTQVKLTISREGQTEPLVIDITRDSITVKSVEWAIQQTPAGATAAVVTISHFTEETAALFRQSAQELLLKQPRGIILDVRSNPGGFLDAAVDIAGNFLDDGTTVVIESQPDSSKSDIRSKGTPLFKGRKVIVLVDGGSASASEILAGALQDYKVATIVGEKTFGKGSVQTFEEFSDGSSLKLTVAKWLTPLGHSIDGEGIVPDVLITDQRAEQNDPILRKGLELIDGD